MNRSFEETLLEDSLSVIAEESDGKVQYEVFHYHKCVPLLVEKTAAPHSGQSGRSLCDCCLWFAVPV